MLTHYCRNNLSKSINQYRSRGKVIAKEITMYFLLSNNIGVSTLLTLQVIALKGFSACLQ